MYLNPKIQVAIKVRHPDIIKKMEMDIRILYSIANFLGRTVFKQLAMPITFDEFKRSLVSQTDLRFEARNLNIFIEKFQHNPNVVFPKPIDPYVSSSVLTETYEEGVSLSKYLDEKPSQLHHRIANLGLKAFYKMLIYDNFIHADCHAGNIFVRVVPAPSTENLSNW
jgi:aarF domain-containing kinase